MSVPAHAGAAVPDVAVADAPAIKQAIAAQKGHVVVVNMWATWCAPCVAEFPALVRLQHRYRKDGLVVFAVSADLRKDVDTKVKPFLKAHGADFPQYLEHASDPEDFINAFDPKWQGDLPQTFIYDRSGRLARVLSGEQSDNSFAVAVKPLLK
jgi:thiol-disulfide isomerase/thioredoxin